MRMIDADALIAQLKCDTKDCDKCPAHDYWFGCGKVKEFINNAPTIDAVPRWIHVDERLPEKDGYYLVTHQWQIFNDEYEINIDEYRRGEWVETPHSCRAVAWMPLPEAYHGERKGND